MKNDRVTIFRSFRDAIIGLPDEVRLEILEAIIGYGLDGIMPEFKNQISRSVFLMAQPNLDISGSKRKSKRGNPNFGKGRPNPYYSGDNSVDNSGDNSTHNSAHNSGDNSVDNSLQIIPTETPTNTIIPDNSEIIPQGIGNRDKGIGIMDKGMGIGNNLSLTPRAREAGKFAPLNANDLAFADFYRQAFKTDFVWQENTSEAVQRLADCITDKGGDKETMPENITAFLTAVYNLNDQWLNQRFTPSLLAKQFNQLYQRITTNGNKQTRNYRQGRADNPTGVSAEFLARIASDLGGGTL